MHHASLKPGNSFQPFRRLKAPAQWLRYAELVLDAFELSSDLRLVSARCLLSGLQARKRRSRLHAAKRFMSSGPKARAGVAPGTSQILVRCAL